MDNDAKEFGKAAYLEAVQQVLDEIGALTNESTFNQYQEVLERVVSISKDKGGRALTNSSRKAELLELKEAYNQERKDKFEKLIALNDQITLLKFQEKYHQESWDLAKTFQVFMSDFVDAYRKRKREENAFEFADISHYTIEILETSLRYVKSIRDVSTKSWLMSTKIPTISRKECWSFSLTGITVLWWEISSSLFIVLDRQIPKSSMKNSTVLLRIAKKVS